MPNPRRKVRKGPWETTSDYSVDNIYTASNDDHGHHSTIRLALHPNTHQSIRQLVQSGAIPAYRTEQDLYRDAITHRIEFWRSRVESRKVKALLASDVTREILAANIERARREVESYRTLEQSIEHFIREGGEADRAWMKRQLRAFKESADELREPFRSKLMRRIEREIGE